MADETKIAISAFADAIIEGINQVIQPSNMLKYGTFTAELIRVRTRLGYGVESQGAPKQALKPLSNDYVKYRQRLQAGAKAFAKGQTSNKAFGELSSQKKRQAAAAAGGLSEFTSPGTSNLTLSQQLLDSIACTDVGEGTATINATGTRSSNGEPSTLINETLAGYVTDAGRPFMNLSDLELAQLENEVRQDLQDAFEKQLTVTK